MSKKRWFFLWLLFIGYLFLGATIFYSIERDLEEERRREKYMKNFQLVGILEHHVALQKNVNLLAVEREKQLDDLINKLSDHCALPLTRSGANATQAEPYTWTYYNSFFFSLTTLSTIGYGNLSPTSDRGKIFVIIYSLIGIPFNGIVLTHLGEFFGSKLLRAHHRYKTHTYESRFSLIVDILIYLIPGMIVFILAPSVIFIFREHWSFVESIYYSFVSLTTIGYGDFVAGQTPGNSAYDIMYQLFLLVWIMFGLGYLVMILGFISRALRSKHINTLERKVAQTLKHTQSKIWNEFVHDVHYLRRIINELYLLKVKPVYKGPGVRTQLSQSCPNLSEWPVLRPRSECESGDDFKPEGTRRRRAISENGEHGQRLPRVLSEAALDGIDVQATFSSSLLDHTGGIFLPSLFAPPSPEESDTEDYKEGGLDMFSDEEILASEEYTSSRVSGDSWFLGGRPLRRPGRAMSDAQVISPSLGHQKTWAGAESLHQFALLKAMRAKSNEWPLDEEKGSKVIDQPAKGFRRLSMAAINFFTPANKLKKKKSNTEIPKFPEETSRPSFFSKDHAKHRLSLQEEDRNALNEELNYFTHMPEGRRPSILDLLAGGRSGDSPISPVLEQTSIADFIRVVHSLKALEAGRPTSPTPQQRARARGRSTSSMGAQAPQRDKLSDRRFSQIPNIEEGGRQRPRAASIAPVLPGPVDRRLRRLSNTPRGSPHSSGRATPVQHRPFPATPSLVVTSPDGRHKFSISSVGELPPLRRADTLKEFPNYKPL